MGPMIYDRATLGLSLISVFFFLPLAPVNPE